MEVESIKVTSPESKSEVCIIPEGIWIYNKKSPQVSAAIHMQGETPVLAVMDHRKEQGGHQLALYVNDKGEPCLQIAFGKDVKTLGYDELIKLYNSVK